MLVMLKAAPNANIRRAADQLAYAAPRTRSNSNEERWQ